MNIIYLMMLLCFSFMSDCNVLWLMALMEWLGTAEMKMENSWYWADCMTRHLWYSEQEKTSDTGCLHLM